MSRIKLLDCTLRDGGHINAGQFGKNVIKSIIKNLVQAKIDIIEVGFLWNDETDENTARFHSINKLKKYLPENLGRSKISLMVDNVDLDYLEPNDGTVDIIRLSFRKNEFEWAKKTVQTLNEKGYSYFLNVIHGSSFTDYEYLKIIEQVNQLHPSGFSIVDTFGAMRQEDLGRIYYMVENNLEPDITLGIHLHENLGLSYSLATYILNIVAPTRSIVIDGSLFGMGKVPGNLCIEQMLDYMNHKYNTNYSIEPVYEAIDEFIMPIRERIPWGYSIPYAISAQCGVHRTYAEYLCEKERLRTKDIRRLMNCIDREHAEIYDKDYIENIYAKYMGAGYNDSITLSSLKKSISQYENVIIISPGTSINTYNFDDNFFTNSCSISVNFIYNKYKTNFSFFANPKRLGFASELNTQNLIITSNLLDDIPNAKFVVSWNELTYHDGVYCDDSTLMLLNLMKRLGVKKVSFVGFDGFQRNENNFYSEYLERNIFKDNFNIQLRKQILKESYSEININFLTPSLYNE